MNKLFFPEISVAKHALSITAVLVTVAGTPVAAGAACDLSSDPALYAERLDQAIILMQYKDLVVRATGGKIRCAEDTNNSRQICKVEGRGEMLVEGGDRAPQVIRLTTDAVGAVHIYASGDISCGLQSDFE